MSKLGKILAVIGAALGVVIGLLLGRSFNRRRGGGDLPAGGGIEGHIDTATEGIGNAADIIENVSEQIDAGTQLADSISNGAGNIESNSERISDIIQAAKDRDNTSGGT